MCKIAENPLTDTAKRASNHYRYGLGFFWVARSRTWSSHHGCVIALREATLIPAGKAGAFFRFPYDLGWGYDHPEVPSKLKWLSWGTQRLSERRGTYIALRYHWANGSHLLAAPDGKGLNCKYIQCTTHMGIQCMSTTRYTLHPVLAREQEHLERMDEDAMRIKRRRQRYSGACRFDKKRGAMVFRTSTSPFPHRTTKHLLTFVNPPR